MGMALFFYLGMALASQTGCGIFLGLVFVLGLVLGTIGRLRNVLRYGICTSVWSLASQAGVEVILGMTFALLFVFSFFHQRHV